MLTCKRVSHATYGPKECSLILETVQGQGGGQAIEDGAALGVLFDQVHDKGAIEDRLQLFGRVRRNRGSALQILSSIIRIPS